MVSIKDSLDKLELYLLELEEKYIDTHDDPLERIRININLMLEVIVFFLMLLLKSLWRIYACTL